MPRRVPPRASAPIARRAFLRLAGAGALAALVPGRASPFGETARLTIGQVQHGGRWNPRPGALRRLGWELARRTSIDPAPDAVPVALERPGLHRYPMLYLAGDGAFPALGDAAVSALRRHLQFGGLLLVDAADGSVGAGFDASARRDLARILPGSPLQPIPREHVLYKSFYLVDRQGGRVLTRPWLEAQALDGRLAVIYSQNDLGGAWTRSDLGDWEYPCSPGGEPQREVAFRIGVNVAMYALCTDYKDDAVHLPFILKRRT